jgi:hypothetical protein
MNPKAVLMAWHAATGSRLAKLLLKQACKISCRQPREITSGKLKVYVIYRTFGWNIKDTGVNWDEAFNIYFPVKNHPLHTEER